ncbi:dTDP-4-dehydrorhamnose 3,5-epimerase [Geojedonia litorea]|uniref:dTDP-4-dehydrorhamnose 3,5-epimerase n=1 Tax=Geojedonia litorea TaxID=1268269 RepID=A0ABV9N3J1_9FLAO
MTIQQTPLKDCVIVTPKVFRDSRGSFLESFNQKAFYGATELPVDFVQDNLSTSSKGVLRGLHFQTGNYAQAKLVSVLKGSVLDVCVDLRRDSKTFGEHFSIKLDDKTKTQLFVPKGFAHGFLVLEDETIFSYKCDNYYNKEAESGIIYNDPYLNINWGISESELILSEKDKQLPTFESLFK